MWAFLAALVIVLGLLRSPPASPPPRTRRRPPASPYRVDPRTGGVAIVTAILVPASFFLDLEDRISGSCSARSESQCLGLFDDVQGMRRSVKLGGVALLALIPVVGYGVTFEHITHRVLREPRHRRERIRRRSSGSRCWRTSSTSSMGWMPSPTGIVVAGASFFARRVVQAHRGGLRGAIVVARHSASSVTTTTRPRSS